MLETDQWIKTEYQEIFDGNTFYESVTNESN